MIHKLFWTADEGMKVNMIIAVKWTAYSVEKNYLKNFAPLSQKVRSKYSGITFKPLRATSGRGLRKYWTFKKISTFPVCAICFIEIITGLPVRPSYKFGFRSSVSKNGLPGEGRHEGLVPRNDVLTNGFIGFSLARTLARILFVPSLRPPETQKALRTWRRLFALFEAIRP